MIDMAGQPHRLVMYGWLRHSMEQSVHTITITDPAFRHQSSLAGLPYRDYFIDGIKAIWTILASSGSCSASRPFFLFLFPSVKGRDDLGGSDPRMGIASILSQLYGSDAWIVIIDRKSGNYWPISCLIGGFLSISWTTAQLGVVTQQIPLVQVG
jgi:hypothetical protein